MANELALSWWDKLPKAEQEVLIRLLYSLDLEQYVRLDEHGNYIEPL